MSATSRKKPPHGPGCGWFLKRKPVQSLGMGRHCPVHGLVYLEDEPKFSALMDAFLGAYRERELLMKKYVKNGKIR